MGFFPDIIGSGAEKEDSPSFSCPVSGPFSVDSNDTDTGVEATPRSGRVDIPRDVVGDDDGNGSGGVDVGV